MSDEAPLTKKLEDIPEPAPEGTAVKRPRPEDDIVPTQGSVRRPRPEDDIGSHNR